MAFAPAFATAKLDIAKASCVVHNDVALGSDLNVLRTSQNGVFLSYLLNGSKRFDIARVAQGDTVAHLYPSQLQQITVATPTAAEQQKIADCLTSLDDCVAAQGRKVEALKAHKKGLMQQLFPREGETLPRLRFPEFRDAGEWEVRTLRDVCDLKAGDFVSASAIAERGGDGLFPCYGGNGLRGYVETFTHNGLYVLVGRQGALCGNVNLFEGRFHATEHALVATQKIGIDVNWLFYALDRLALNRFSIGQAQPGLSVGVLNGVGIEVARETAEQRRIASCLSSLDARVAAEGEKLAALKLHKKGLMQQLFPLPEGLSYA
jgi:type I restriction enzyme S subunit